MRKIKLVLALLLFGILLYPQEKKLLVDCIHGADYYYSPIDGITSINFEELFPEYEVTIIGKNSIPFYELIINEEQAGNQNLEYEIDLPDSYVPVALYVVVSTDSVAEFDYVTGSIMNPDSIVVEEMFNGILHHDGASGSGWKVNLSLGHADNYHIKIGAGLLLYNYDNIQLSDYDVMLRIKDNTWYAINGTSPEYSDYDMEAFSSAFDNGMGFLNVQNKFESMFEKPFVHFNTDSEINIDFQVNIQGRSKYHLPKPERQEKELKWQHHLLLKNQQNEIVYEVLPDEKLNFIHFTIDGTNVKISSQIKSSLYNIQLLKYEGNNIYSYSFMDALEPGKTHNIENQDEYSSGQILELMKKELYKEAINSGLSEKEAKHFVYSYNWIETLLHEAYNRPDHYFGLYQFKTDVYNRLLPCRVNPVPENMNRNMWVMLSDIQNRNIEKVIEFPREYSGGTQKTGDFDLIEYGMVKEQYSLKGISTENDFFGVKLYDYIYYIYETDINFYQNNLAASINRDIDSLVSVNGYYLFYVYEVSDMGISFDTSFVEYPLTMGFKLHNNGKQIALGTSEYFNGDTSNTIFINNCLDALYVGDYFVSSEYHSLTSDSPKVNIFPNPFNDFLIINLSLSERSQVEIKIYTIDGKLVDNVFTGNLIKGIHSFRWNNQNIDILAPNVYVCKITTGYTTIMEKLILIRN